MSPLHYKLQISFLHIKWEQSQYKQSLIKWINIYNDLRKLSIGNILKISYCKDVLENVCFRKIILHKHLKLTFKTSMHTKKLKKGEENITVITHALPLNPCAIEQVL